MQMFTLSIKMGNAEVQTVADVGHLLEKIARRMGEGMYENSLQAAFMDANGNRVGSWAITEVEDRDDARRTDPRTSHERSAGRVDYDDLMRRVWAHWDDTIMPLSDDDFALLVNKPRNVAAKIRQTLEKQGRLARVGTAINDNNQRVMTFRPIS